MNVLYDAKAIRVRLAAIAERITADYAGREIDLVYMINGATLFAADLVRHIGVPVRQHGLGFTSYPDAPQSGAIRVTLDVAESLQDRHVLVAEGIVVSGRTPRYVMDMLQLRRPASLEMCAVGIKPHSLAVDLQVRYALFEFRGQLAAGYGIGKGPERALPDLVDLS